MSSGNSFLTDPQVILNTDTGFIFLKGHSEYAIILGTMAAHWLCCLIGQKSNSLEHSGPDQSDSTLTFSLYLSWFPRDPLLYPGRSDSSPNRSCSCFFINSRNFTCSACFLHDCSPYVPSPTFCCSIWADSICRPRPNINLAENFPLPHPHLPVIMSSIESLSQYKPWI